jgi:hypothetical protein
MGTHQVTHPWTMRKRWHAVAAVFAVLAVTTPFAHVSDLLWTHEIRMLDSPGSVIVFVLPLFGLVVWPLFLTPISRGGNFAGFMFSLLATLMLLFELKLVTAIVGSSGDGLSQAGHPFLAEVMRSVVGNIFSFGPGFSCLFITYMILTYSYYRGFRSFRRVRAVPPAVPSSDLLRVQSRP